MFPEIGGQVTAQVVLGVVWMPGVVRLGMVASRGTTKVSADGPWVGRSLGRRSFSSSLISSPALEIGAGEAAEASG